MRNLLVLGVSLSAFGSVAAQAPGHWPPDSLTNTRVIPHSTPVMQLVGTMRNFTSDLGVRCQFCHVGREGQPLDQFDFISDEKRTKQVARQMMLMRVCAQHSGNLFASADLTVTREQRAACVRICRACHR